MGFYNDRRLFRRYRQTTDFYVIIDANYYKAATVDFSLSGLCIFIEGTPPLRPNSFIDLKIEGLDIDIRGRVIWVQQTDQNLLVGIEKMAIAGLLRICPLSHILLDLQRSNVTGVLEMEKRPVLKRIYIKHGVMVFAASNQHEDRFGELLLKRGRITSDQLHQAAVLLSSSGKRLGTILVELGYLKPDELVRALKYQVEEIILSLFRWQEGTVRFLAGPLPDEIITFRLSAANLIFQGIKRITQPEYFRNICPPPDTILYFSNDPLNLFQDVSLSEEDRYVLSLLDARLTLKEIIDLSSLEKSRTIKIISALFSISMIEKKGEKILADRTIVKTISEPQKAVDSAFLENVSDLCRKFPSMDYYSILGISSGASLKQIRKAYYAMVKEFHPDRHISASSGMLKSRLNEILSHVINAYRTLSDSELRAHYDDTLKVRRPPEAPDVTKKAVTARERFIQGKEALKNGLYEDAAEFLGQAVYLDSSMAEYHSCLAIAYRKLKRLRDAQKEMQKALEIDQTVADYYAEIGEIYLELGLPLRARASFEKALKTDPSHKRAADRLKMLDTGKHG
ncbi:MAG: DUF4388 domain-containing protein [Nitrospirota bacterium]